MVLDREVIGVELEVAAYGLEVDCAQRLGEGVGGNELAAVLLQRRIDQAGSVVSHGCTRRRNSFVGFLEVGDEFFIQWVVELFAPVGRGLYAQRCVANAR